jgi:endonuclease III
MHRPKLSIYELERRLIYSIIVAGKSARFTEGAMARLFGPWQQPFERLRFLDRTGKLHATIRAARTGNYTKLERAIRELIAANLDLWTCSVADLEKIHGIGPKTARFFLMWTGRKERVAALDVHVLRWLHHQGYPNVPRSTPTGRRYAELEKIFLAEADARKMTPRQLDSQIWEKGARWND